MKDRLPLVVAELKTLLGSPGKEFLDHLDVILLQTIIQRQASVIVSSVQSRPNFINQLELLVKTHDVFDRLPLVVLLATSFVEFVVPDEPIINSLVTISGAFK